MLRRRGKGVFQIVEDLHLDSAGLGRIRRLAEVAERPVTFSIGTGNQGPQKWPELLDQLSAANEAGLTIKAQLMPRGIGLMLGHELTLNPFYATPSYRALAPLPLPEKLERLREPEVRAAILSEGSLADPASALGETVRNFATMFQLGDPPAYEQPPERSIAARAERAGVTPEALAYDLMLDGPRGGTLYLAMANYLDGSLDAVGEMLRHPHVIPGLGDGGAHCGTICDGSYSTYALMHWGRDRAAARMPVETLVRRMTHDPATLMGLADRGRIAAGLRADLNVIDMGTLALAPPVITHDLPGGGRRLVQRARGFRNTIVAGEVVAENDAPAGPLPGRLIRA